MPRFRYSLRTLLIVVTIVAVALGAYIVPQSRIVRKRRELIIRAYFAVHAHDQSQLPLIRRWLGDTAISNIRPKDVVDEAEYREWFPEASWTYFIEQHP